MRLVVTAPRGSGGSYAHLSRVLPRILDLKPDWDVELYGSPDVLEAAFGTTGQPWMRPLAGGDYRTRLRWEFLELPALLRRDPDALVYSPFGPPLNLSIAGRAVWASRNIIPLLPLDTWEISDADRARLLAVRMLLVPWARWARRSICVSEHARRRLSELAAVPVGHIAAIPHGTDPPLERACSSQAAEGIRGRRYILHVGQAVAYRRTLALARAYARLAARRRDLPPLVMVGRARPQDSAYEERCLAELEPLVQRGRVIMLGQVPHADTLALIAAAHTFVYPSVHEDCPNIVLEALAAGRVGVYADIPAVRELAADAAIYAHDAEPAALAVAMERATFDEETRMQLSAAAMKRAQHFTWDLTARRTTELLDGAFALPPRGASRRSS
jgi:glycosyltransferase involved in cell wall biosynthesis